jgi:gluconate 2-dehydrogenase alpha chain
MATRLKKTDVVIVGMGAAGGTAALPLAKAGAKIIGLEAGGRYTPVDFIADEVRHDILNWLGRATANWEVPTVRSNAADVAVKGQGIVMMNGVGGSSVHYTGQSWRLSPYTFKERSETIRRYGAGAIPATVALADWPVDYDDLEPYYDHVEHEIGISGKAGRVRGQKADPAGNVFEGVRRRDYPMPPLRTSAYTEMMADAARDLKWHPFPGPAAILSREFKQRPACDYHGFCTFNGCHTTAKSSTCFTTIPEAEATKNLKILTRARVIRVETDSNGRATGVTYIRGGEEFFQPADVVVLSTYVYENVRLMMFSKSAQHPNGIGNSADQLGRYYMAHSYYTVNGLFPGKQLNLFTGTGGQQTAVDTWDSDNFDHGGLGFIGGATFSASHENKPISGIASTTPPDVPRWGSAWKAWLKQNANSVGASFIQVPVQPYENNRLDLDPTHKDQYGQPVVRITFSLGVNEQRMVEYLTPKMTEWLNTAGATQTWHGPLFPLALNSHAFGGTRMGDDPKSSVVDKNLFVHDAPNVAVISGSVFPSTGAKNPTQTIEALAWRAGEYIGRNMDRLAA